MSTGRYTVQIFGCSHYSLPVALLFTHRWNWARGADVQQLMSTMTVWISARCRLEGNSCIFNNSKPILDRPAERVMTPVHLWESGLYNTEQKRIQLSSVHNPVLVFGLRGRNVPYPSDGFGVSHCAHESLTFRMLFPQLCYSAASEDDRFISASFILYYFQLQ